MRGDHDVTGEAPMVPELEEPVLPRPVLGGCTDVEVPAGGTYP
jgi:hypothetical protein